MPAIEDGLNQIVTVTIEYADGTDAQVRMTKREAIKLQDAVAAKQKPGIKRVKW